MKYLVTTLFLCSFWMRIHGEAMMEKIFVLEKGSGEDMQRMLVVTWGKDQELDGGCEVFTDQELIDEVLSSSEDHPIRRSSEDEMEVLLENCEFATLRRRRETDDSSQVRISDRNKDAVESTYNSRSRGGRRINIESDSSRNSNYHKSDRNSSDEKSDKQSNGWRFENERRVSNSNEKNSNDEKENHPLEDWGAPSTAPTTTEGYGGWPVIYPGTKWCGAGDIAKNYDDLGLHQDTDRCCRAHDLCNDTMAPGETKNNLTNKSPFTKLSCKCDEDFYKCLDKVNTVISNTIGNMYFNVLRRECYSKDYPLTKKCKKYRSFLKITCVEYEKDTSAKPVYQWEKPKKYKKIPFPGPLTFTLPF